MLHSGCVKRHQKFRDFVGLPMGLLRDGSPKTRMNTGLFGSWSGEYGYNQGITTVCFRNDWVVRRVEAGRNSCTAMGLCFPGW